MSDRINALTVILEKDIRDDDCEQLKAAISQLRGVLEVKARVANHQDVIAYTRARHVLEKRLWDALEKEIE